MGLPHQNDQITPLVQSSLLMPRLRSFNSLETGTRRLSIIAETKVFVFSPPVQSQFIGVYSVEATHFLTCFRSRTPHLVTFVDFGVSFAATVVGRCTRRGGPRRSVRGGPLIVLTRGPLYLLCNVAPQ